MLLTSLYYQTFKNFDLIIVDGNKENPIRNQKYISDILLRFKVRGHGVKYIIEDVRKGISAARNLAVREAFPSEFHCRIDDDSVLEPDYLEKLHYMLSKKIVSPDKIELVGIAGGIVPYYGAPSIYRNSNLLGSLFETIKYEDGRINVTDNGGFQWMPNKIMLSHHCRSSFAFRYSAWKKVNGFSEDMGGMISGFREETDFAIKIAYEGYKIMTDTSATAWHIRSGTGGVKPETNNPMEYQQQYSEAVQINEEHFQKKFNRLYNRRGDPFAGWRK